MGIYLNAFLGRLVDEWGLPFVFLLWFVLLGIVGYVIADGCKTWIKASKSKRGPSTAEIERWKASGVDIWKTPANTSATNALTSAAHLVSPHNPAPLYKSVEVDLSRVDRLTLSKIKMVLEKYPDAYITGFVINLNTNGVSHAIVDQSSVRWLETRKFWEIMHPNDGS